MIAIFNDHTPIKLGDELLLSHPASVSRLLAKKNFDAYARSVPEKWDALERAGFRAEPYGDLIHTLNVRLGGHYLDVGTSAKIEKGFVSLVFSIRKNPRDHVLSVRVKDQGKVWSGAGAVHAKRSLFR